MEMSDFILRNNFLQIALPETTELSVILALSFSSCYYFFSLLCLFSFFFPSPSPSPFFFPLCRQVFKAETENEILVVKSYLAITQNKVACCLHLFFFIFFLTVFQALLHSLLHETVSRNLNCIEQNLEKT